MVIIGHQFLKTKPFYKITSIDDISKTPPMSTLYIEFNEKNTEIIKYCQTNNIATAIYTKEVTQVVLSSLLGACFIVVDDIELAKKAQNIANNYLFDAKILIKIKQSTEIEDIALEGIDGVVFEDAII